MTRKRDYHAKGQSDAAKGRYDPPHERMPIIGDIFHVRDKKEIRDRKQYHEGKHDHERQTKKR